MQGGLIEFLYGDNMTARKRTDQTVTQLAFPWIDVPTEWTISDIGAPLLGSLAEGLYSAEEVLREYVQNAIDSYVDFRLVTGRQPPNTVQVFIDPDTAEVHVLDQGVGMDGEDIKRAKAIAVSPKLQRMNEFVGFRGIGIWSGLSACDRLVLETTKVGVPFLYQLTIDFKGIREHVYNPIPIDVLLQGRITIRETPTGAEDHYTHVRLLNVQRESCGRLLDIKKMIRYAEQYLPVPYDPAWYYTEKVREGLARIPWTGTYDLTINGDPIYRRFPSVTEHRLDLKAPEFMTVTDIGGREVAFAWFCETNRTGQRKAIEADIEKGEVKNFAVRIKNFTVGSRGLYADPSVVLDSDNLDWYVGEIYVIDTDIKPDTNRRTFQRSARSQYVVEALQKWLSGL